MVAIILNLNSCKRHLPSSITKELSANETSEVVIPAALRHDHHKPWKSTYRVDMISFYNTIMGYIKTKVNRQLLQSKREKLQKIVSFDVPLGKCEEWMGDLAELH